MIHVVSTSIYWSTLTQRPRTNCSTQFNAAGPQPPPPPPTKQTYQALLLCVNIITDTVTLTWISSLDPQPTRVFGVCFDQLNAVARRIFGSTLHFHEQNLNKLHKLVSNVNVHLKFKVSNDLKIVINSWRGEHSNTTREGGLIDHGGGIIVLSTVVAKWSVAFVIIAWLVFRRRWRWR